MRIIFNSSFEDELKEYGNTLYLYAYSLRMVDNENDLKEDDPERTYKTFDSIWESQEKCLSITLNLSYLDSELIEDKKRAVIYVYYANLSGQIKGEAFRLLGDTDSNGALLPLNLCSFGLENSVKRTDLNYIRVSFPDYTKANIKTRISDNNIQYLERSSNIPGVNCFILGRDGYGTGNYITKDSFYKYQRNLVSQNNKYPTYLDMNGEKVYTITTYKEYKEISIYPVSIVGDDSYFIVNGSNVTISGTVLYDLYTIKNGEYTLEKSGCTEDLSETTLIGIDSDKTGYTINDTDKVIKFEKSNESFERNFQCTLTYTNTRTTNKEVTIKSNSLKFITYSRLSVEYSSNFSDTDKNGNSHVLLMFDKDSNNTGWNPDYNDEYEKPGRIVVYSDVNSIKENIKILGDDTNSTDLLFGNADKDITGYFSYTISDPVEQEDGRFKYLITISTLGENTEEKWYPLDSGGNSKLLLCHLKFNTSGTDDWYNLDDQATFYCVQRCSYPLQIAQINTKSVRVGESIYAELARRADSGNYTLDIYGADRFGVKVSDQFYILGNISGYNRWKLSSTETELGKCEVMNSANNILDPTIPAKLDGSDSVSVFTRYQRRLDKDVTLGTLTFSRVREDTGTYEPTNWKDVMYCHGSNSAKLDVVLKQYVDTIPNNSFYSTIHVDIPSNYYYSRYSEGDDETYNYGLLIFNRQQETKTINITVDQDKPEIDVDKDFNTYFSYKVGDWDATKKSLSIEITNNILSSDYNLYSWYPQIPLSIKITSSDKTFFEYVYCVIRPSFENYPLSVYDLDKKKVQEIKLMIGDKKDTYRAKQYYINGSNVFNQYFNYWFPRSYDNFLNIVPTSSGSSVYNTTYVGYPIVTNLSATDKLVTEVRTKGLPETTLDRYLEPIKLKRCCTQYTNIISYIKDWRNQLVLDDEVSVPVYLEGQTPSTTTKAYIYKDDGELSLIEDEGLMELDHIGLYRIYVRSNSKYRVSISNTSSEDGFYFYDIPTDSVLYNILTVDESSFNNVSGNEICFAFLGNEPGAFSTEEQTLRTTITVKNLTDNTSSIIKLHRQYSTIHTNIVKTSDDTLGNDKGHYFLGTVKFNSVSSVKYRSNVETIGTFDVNANYLKSLGTTGNIRVSDSKVMLRYDQYGNINTYTSEDSSTESFISRGYVSTENEIDFSGVGELYNQLYPISPIGKISINNPLKYNNESLSLMIYKLKPLPETTCNISTTEGVKINYQAGSHKSIDLVGAVDSTFEVYFTGLNTSLAAPTKYSEIDTSVWKKIDSAAGTTFTSSEANEDFTVTESITKETNKAVYTITNANNTPYTPDKDVDVVIGQVLVITYINNTKFLKNTNGTIITSYTQDEVDSIIGVKADIYPIKRMCKNHSVSSISADLKLISEFGESRNYGLSLIDDKATVYVTLTDAEKVYLDGLTYDSTNSVIMANFKSRLERDGYTNSNFRYGVQVSFNQLKSGEVILDTDTLNKLKPFSSDQKDSSFTVKVTNSDSSVENLTCQATQDTWKTGLFVVYGSSAYIILGNNISVIDQSIDYDSTSYDIYAIPVTLPTSYDGSSISSAIVARNAKPIISSVFGVVPTISDSTVEKSVYSYKYGYSQTWNMYKINISTSENTSSTYRFLGEFTLGDPESKNTARVSLSQTARTDYDLYIINEYYVTESSDCFTYSNEITSQENIDKLIFSASGSLRYPDGLFLVTNYDGSVNSEINSYIDTNSVKLQSGKTNYNSLRFDTRISVIGSGKKMKHTVNGKVVDFTNSNNETYYGYRITLTSRVYSFDKNSSDSTFNIDDYFPMDPFYGTFTFELLNYTNSLTVTAYYGAARLRLDGPYITRLSVERESGQPEVSSIYAFYGNTSVDENNKHSDGDYRTSNTKPINSYTYRLNDWIYVVYRDGNGGKKFFVADHTNTDKTLFEEYGYYEAFSLSAVRKEWTMLEDEPEPKVTNFTKFSFSTDVPIYWVPNNNSGSSSSATNLSIYKDHLMDRGTDNPETVIYFPPSPRSSAGTYVSSEDGNIMIVPNLTGMSQSSNGEGYIGTYKIYVGAEYQYWIGHGQSIKSITADEITYTVQTTMIKPSN